MITDHLAPSFKKLHSKNKISDEWCINHEQKKIFLCISKCASKSMIDTLKKENYQIIENEKITTNDILSFKDYKFYSIIRNPDSRYVSGLNFFMWFRLNLEEKEYNEQMVEYHLSNEKFIFDEHTLPQSFLLYKVTKYYEVNFIKLDDNLNESVSNFLGIDASIPKLNTKNNDYSDFCQEMYLKYCINNKNFLEVYGKDYKIYNKL